MAITSYFGMSRVKRFMLAALHTFVSCFSFNLQFQLQRQLLLSALTFQQRDMIVGAYACTACVCVFVCVCVRVRGCVWVRSTRPTTAGGGGDAVIPLKSIIIIIIITAAGLGCKYKVPDHDSIIIMIKGLVGGGTRSARESFFQLKKGMSIRWVQ